MAKIKFREIRLSAENQQRLGQINSIIREYQAQNMKLTLRQLYYQLVSRDVIPNQQKEYAKLSKVLVEGRMAGVVDWGAIEDRLRTAEKPAAWDTPADGIDSLIEQYECPRMKGQDNYIECWVEKDALSGVLSIVTEEFHVPILVNRGYSSASAIFDSYKRFKAALEAGQHIKILYLGDFDPSGMDMIRDVTDRPLEMLLSKAREIIRKVYDEWLEEDEDNFSILTDHYYHDEECQTDFGEDDRGLEFDPWKAFIKSRFKVIPIALTRDQITQYKPPPNPAKKTDPRAKKFIKAHGGQSWEVDALRPEVLNGLLRDAILINIDYTKYAAVLKQEKVDIKRFEAVKDKV